MAEKPAYVANFVKPPNSMIKHIGNSWYLYERYSEYDPVRKRTIKRSGPIIGAITENGLVPSVHRARSTAAVAEVEAGDSTSTDIPPEEIRGTEAPGVQENPPAEPGARVPGTRTDILAGQMACSTVEFGAVAFLYGITGTIRERLERFFPDYWASIYTVAMLRAIYGKGGRLCRLERQYKSSLLAHIYPGMDLSRTNMTQFMAGLGLSQHAIKGYMREDASAGEQLLIVDGHRIVTVSRGIHSAKLGYDSRRRYQPQLNVMYLFASDADDCRPSFYKKYNGNVSDVTAVDDLLDDSGMINSSVTAIGDKGTQSGPVFDKIEQSGAKYIFAVRRGEGIAKKDYPSVEEYQGTFHYHNRAVSYYTVLSGDGKSKYILYLDFSLLAAEMRDAVSRADKQLENTCRKLSKVVAERQKSLADAEKMAASKQRDLYAAEGRLSKAESQLSSAVSRLESAIREENDAEEKASQKQARAEAKAKRIDTERGRAAYEDARRILGDALSRAGKKHEATERLRDEVDRRRTIAEAERKKLDEIRDSFSKATELQKAVQEALDAARKMQEMAARQDDLRDDEKAGDTEIQNGSCSGGSGKQPDCCYTRLRGTFVLHTNRMDLSPRDVYIGYKQRPKIEEYFKLYDCTLGFDSPYLQDDASVDGWLFLNHLSASMTVMALNTLAQTGLSNVSFLSLMDTLAALRASCESEDWELEPMNRKTEELCKKLGIDAKEFFANI